MSKVNKKKYFALGLIIILTLVLVCVQYGAAKEATTIEASSASSDNAFPLKIEQYEVDIHFNYDIPDAKKIAETKDKLMKKEEFMQDVKKLGKEAAEKMLDSELQADVDYLVEKNKKGSEKFPIVKAGDNSAYWSPWTYILDDFGNCTTNRADPMNLFFFNLGNWYNVAGHLASHGWSGGAWGGNQCAWTAEFLPAEFHSSMLVPQTIQMETSGFLSFFGRDHMRIWLGIYTGGAEGFWSVAAVHREVLDWYDWARIDHCLVPYHPDGSSFDRAEYTVWADSLYYFNHWFFLYPNVPNTGWYGSCGNSVWNDGYTVGIDVSQCSTYGCW